MATSHNGNGERMDAKVGGQQVGIRSAYPVVLVLLVCVVPLLIWLIQKERKELVDQFLGTLTTIAATHRADTQVLRELAVAHHQEQMARQLDFARATLRILINIDYNIRHVGEPEELPFGTLPPWFHAPPLPQPKDK